jgi:parallel beta-helix repeat protein
MPRWWGGILLFALLISPALVPDAAAQQTVLYACVNTSSGEVKLVSPGTACHNNWTLVMWNVTGSQGPAGPVGPTGPAGPVGPIGPAGPLGIPVPVAVTVDCSAGQSITNVLQTVSGSPLTITVSGVCSENVTITRNDVTLQGAAAGSGITGPDTTQDTVVIQGAQRVALDSLTVSGGYNGVTGNGGAAFTVQRSTIQNARNNGIVVRASSSASIDSNTVTGNASDGIQVRENSNATITNNTIQSNAIYGIQIRQASSALIGQTDAGTAAGNLIEGHGRDGIRVYFVSSAHLYGNTIQHNGLLGQDQGMSVDWHSAVRLIGLNTITANTGPGIDVRTSTLRTGSGDGITPSTNEISNNIGGGIWAEKNAYLDLREGLTITNNQYNPAWSGFGLYLDQGSRLRIQNTTISGNAQGGINLFMASTAQFMSGSNVSGNGSGFDLQCHDNGTDRSYSVSVSGRGVAPVKIEPNCTPFY